MVLNYILVGCSWNHHFLRVPFCHLLQIFSKSLAKLNFARFTIFVKITTCCGTPSQSRLNRSFAKTMRNFHHIRRSNSPLFMGPLMPSPLNFVQNFGESLPNSSYLLKSLLGRGPVCHLIWIFANVWRIFVNYKFATFAKACISGHISQTAGIMTFLRIKRVIIIN